MLEVLNVFILSLVHVCALVVLQTPSQVPPQSCYNCPVDRRPDNCNDNISGLVALASPLSNDPKLMLQWSGRTPAEQL